MGAALMEVVLRSAVVFFFLLVLVRVMGKKELSELSAFEMVLLVVMGDLVQQGVTTEDLSLTGALLSVSTLGLLVVAISYVEFRWSRARPGLQGVPVVVVEDGHLLEDVMRTERLTVEEIVEGARQQGIEDLSAIRFGILEVSGRLTFVERK